MRPGVSVVVPFLGDESQAREVVERLEALTRGPDDELLIADNTPGAIAGQVAGTEIAVVHAPDRRSAAYARNAGAARASNAWLLFLDADCSPPPGLLDAYFEPPPQERCGVVAGEISGDPAQRGALARWARSRRGDWITGLRAEGLRPAGVTANMLVRRTAFGAVGGFRQGGGSDLDLSWRLQDAGWDLEYRPQARVHHRDRESLRELGVQARTYGAHRARLRRVHGESAIPRPRLVRPLFRSLGGAATWLARREPERARFALLDAYYFSNAWVGALTGGPRRRRAD